MMLVTHFLVLTLMLIAGIKMANIRFTNRLLK
jgi:hypothetical protein